MIIVLRERMMKDGRVTFTLEEEDRGKGVGTGFMGGSPESFCQPLECHLAVCAGMISWSDPTWEAQHHLEFQRKSGDNGEESGCK